MILSAIAAKLKSRSKDDFKGRHFEAGLIVQAVSWYLRYPLSYRDIEELLLERGLEVDHSTVNRWVLAYGAAVPDFPGCNAMGATLGEVEANAIAALREWAIDYLDGSDELPAARTIEELRRDESLFDDFTPNTLVLPLPLPLPLFLDGARPTKANISMEAGLLAEIDEAARRRGLTRSAFLASAARDKIAAERGLQTAAG